jgi:hypothetical protein
MFHLPLSNPVRYADIQAFYYFCRTKYFINMKGMKISRRLRRFAQTVFFNIINDILT